MPSVDQLAEFRRHAEWALVAATAVETGVADALAGSAKSAESVALELGLSVRGTEVLLGALVELGAAEPQDGGYRLTEHGRGALVERGSPGFQGDAIRQWHQNIRSWVLQLEDAVRAGGPPDEPEAAGTQGTSDPEALERFMRAMDEKPRAQVAAVVQICLDRAADARTMLDLGGGPGTFARAFAARGLQATLFDRPEVIDHVAGSFGLADDRGIRLEKGDFLLHPPSGTYDVLLLSNITHIYGRDPNRELLARMAEHLNPGGVLAVLDFVRGQGDFAALFALTMLLHTEGGNTYAEQDYREWLESAGLRETRIDEIDQDRRLITAVR